ncbi:PHB depolymerase family esterase [Lacibacter sp. H375]|uniref:alpha/beta hydrolase family esterase n=1 Tax=Lacibacter sp. H375 TaxID=3133424 RepID=UPI0030BD8206
MKTCLLRFFTFICIISVFLACRKGKSSAKTYRFNETITVDGLSRSYVLNLPPDYYDNTGFALVIAMHGGGGSATQFESTSKLTEKANASGFIVVYPEGTGVINTWNAGTCCGSSVSNNINDVKFISMLIDKLVAAYKINPKKVYATGHSNGGMMSYRLACELSNKIAAIAPNGSTMVVTQACNPARAVPVLHMHSKLDQHVVYTGGYGNGVSGVYCPPLDSVLNVWSLKNSCAIQAQVIVNNSNYTHKRWLNCTNNVTIDYYLTNDGGHGWPGGLPGGPNSDIPSTSINANDLLWSFFQQYQLP